MVRTASLIALLLAGASVPAYAQLQPEELHVEQLADAMQPHWFWVNDVSFDRMLDGRAYLLDADSGRMLGMVAGGYGQGVLLLSPDGKTVGELATFFSRGSRGTRTDVVTFYKISDLAPGQEAIVPAKRYSGMPFLSVSPVMPGGRFALIYNFTPEQSVTVIDMKGEKTLGEFATPGCGLIYPTGSSKFFMICSDGSLQPATLDDQGKVALGTATKKLFADNDPVTEKGVWTGREWLFFTPSGKVDVIDHSGAQPIVKRAWSLTGKDEATWRPGALQTAAYHRGTGRLYVLMHEGGPDTHKDPGTELWVYDAAKGTRIERFKLEVPATAVAVSQDDKPLLYTTLMGDRDVRIYDASTGKLVRKIEGLGPTMSVIQPAPIAGEQ